MYCTWLCQKVFIFHLIHNLSLGAIYQETIPTKTVIESREKIHSPNQHWRQWERVMQSEVTATSYMVGWQIKVEIINRIIGIPETNFKHSFNSSHGFGIVCLAARLPTFSASKICTTHFGLSWIGTFFHGTTYFARKRWMCEKSFVLVNEVWNELTSKEFVLRMRMRIR